jgi:hypothetical protein
MSEPSQADEYRFKFLKLKFILLWHVYLQVTESAEQNALAPHGFDAQGFVSSF